jgi:curved DNA-binding protein CbpA
MGQSQSSLYDNYYSALQNNQNIDISTLNPYDVLDVKEDFSWEELVKAYRKLAIKVHPDKGGSEILFDAVTKCFKQLATEFKARQVEKPHHVLKKEFEEFKEEGKKPEFPSFPQNTTFNEKFNKLYEDNKLEDDDDNRGYSHFMAKSQKEREDFKIPKLLNKFTEKKFNETFEKVVKPGKDIIIYKEPEPVMAAKNLNFTELGGKTEEFTTTAYTDYYKAHTTSRLVDTRSVTKRKEYKTIADYEEDRKISAETVLSEAEIKYQTELDIYRINKEDQRVQRLKEKDDNADRHFEKINKAMIGLRL